MVSYTRNLCSEWKQKNNGKKKKGYIRSKFDENYKLVLYILEALWWTPTENAVQMWRLMMPYTHTHTHRV